MPGCTSREIFTHFHGNVRHNNQQSSKKPIYIIIATTTKKREKERKKDLGKLSYYIYRI